MTEEDTKKQTGEMGKGPEEYSNLGSQSYAVETSQGHANVVAHQETTRGDGTLELRGNKFGRESVGFSGVKEHLAIHQGSEVAGSQFNGELFPDSESLVTFLSQVLPEELEYDQFGRVEITLDVKLPNQEALGFSGVKSIEELKAEGVEIEKGVRTPGGEEGEVGGVKGAWYPEVIRNPETGKFETATNPDGSIKNPHGKFEPEASIATVTDAKAAETTKVSVVILQDQETSEPFVVTAYPGEIAPPFPAKIQSEAFSVDTLKGKEAEYWEKHAFIKFA